MSNRQSSRYLEYDFVGHPLSKSEESWGKRWGRPKSDALLLYVSTFREGILLALLERGGSEENQADTIHIASPSQNDKPILTLDSCWLLD